MFSHVMLGVNDLERSKKFYDALLGTLGTLGTLGIGPGWLTPSVISTAVQRARLASPRRLMASHATHGNGSTLGFVVQCPSRAMRSMRWMWSSVTWQSSKCKLDAKP
jgi:hypothetical protein